VIARPFAGPHIAVDAGGNQAAGNGWAQQQMIDAQPGIAGKGVPEIFPERVDPLIGVHGPHRVGPALRDQAAISVAHLRPEQGVIDSALRRIDIQVGRHDVEVARQNGRRAALQKGFGVARQPLEPAQLIIIIEFRSGLPWMGHAAGPTRMSRIETDKTILPYLPLSTEERAGNLIRECVARGTSHLRTHVDIDLESGLAKLEGVLAAPASL
jgi:hypothetical protein